MQIRLLTCFLHSHALSPRHGDSRHRSRTGPIRNFTKGISNRADSYLQTNVERDARVLIQLHDLLPFQKFLDPLHGSLYENLIITHKRPQTIDGMDIDEFIRRNADPIWLHQNKMWEYMTDDEGS